MPRRDSEHMHLSKALKRFIQENKLQGGIDKVDAREAWIKLMGNGVNNYTQSVELKGDVLYVALTSSVLREELSYGKSKIIKMMNEDLGKELIKTLVLR